MNRGTGTRRLMSWLLLVGGGCLLFFGARDWFESHSGQRDAEREFEQPVPASFPTNVAGSHAGKNHPPLRRLPEPGDSIAKLTIPRLDAQLYVLEGIGSRQLRRGPAHMTGSALPGEDGNCIIAGHRDTHFRVLKDVRKGDDIRVRTSAGEYVYKVNGISIVSENNKAALRDTRDAKLHLITCYPFYYVGNAPRRFVVEATLSSTARSAHTGS
jgi:sortase A